MRWVWEKRMSFSCCLCLYLPRRRWHPPNYFASVNMEAVEIVSPCSTARILSQTSVNIILRLFLPFMGGSLPLTRSNGLASFQDLDIPLFANQGWLCLEVSGGSLLMTITFIITACNQWSGQLLGWTGQYIEVGGCWGEMRCGRRERWFRWLRLQQEVATALLPAGLENLQFISQYLHTVHYTQHLLSLKVSGLQIRFSAQIAF